MTTVPNNNHRNCCSSCCSCCSCCIIGMSPSSLHNNENGNGCSRLPLLSFTPDERTRIATLALQLWRSHRVRNLFVVSATSWLCCSADELEQQQERRNVIVASGRHFIDEPAGECCRHTEQTTPSARATQKTRQDIHIDKIRDDEVQQQQQQKQQPEVRRIIDILAFNPHEFAVSSNRDDSKSLENALLWHRHHVFPHQFEISANLSTTTDIDGTSFNEFLRRANCINFLGAPLNISFFPATMAYLKRTMDYFQKSHMNDCEEDGCVGAYFGTDCELVKELAVRLNFTARLMEPLDGLEYGFKVIYI